MNAMFQHNLALILFLPWFAILGALYWYYPRTLVKSPARRRFDLVALVMAVGLSFVCMRAGMEIARSDVEAGAIWKQVLATLLAYHAFLAVLAGAWFWRRRRFSPSG